MGGLVQTVITILLTLLGGSGVIGIYLKVRPQSQKIDAEADASLRGDLIGLLDSERRDCLERLDAQDKKIIRIEESQEAERRNCDQRLRDIRHELNGERQERAGLKAIARHAPEKVIDYLRDMSGIPVGDDELTMLAKQVETKGDGE